MEFLHANSSENEVETLFSQISSGDCIAPITKADLKEALDSFKSNDMTAATRESIAVCALLMPAFRFVIFEHRVHRTDHDVTDETPDIVSEVVQLHETSELQSSGSQIHTICLYRCNSTMHYYFFTPVNSRPLFNLAGFRKLISGVGTSCASTSMRWQKANAWRPATSWRPRSVPSR